jgi:hypothetical protein
VSEALRDAFLRDVAASIRYWEEWAQRQLDDGQTAGDVVRGAIRGVVHSALVTIDGGTALSDGGRQVWLTDATGAPVEEGLHEYLFDYLPDVQP